MLFNSYAFIFVFVPLTLWGFFSFGAARPRAAAAWLALASLVFYGYWNPIYVLLLIASVGFNFVAGLQLMRNAGSARGRTILAAAITANLVLLGYYKYANFFVANVNAMFGTGLTIGAVVLPLGISFFTFTQIAFLVDAYRSEVREYNFIHYLLFVTYFPHLIAGPVLHHKEMMPQFSLPSTYRISAENIAVGLTMFLIGLAKKVLLADNVAGFAAPVFDAAASGHTLTFVEAWGGALAYTVQLYFDFSGYSDMAIGLSFMFGVRLPLNFNSPYKASNIIEFWRRWHMTLSRFLRDYLYIALGGNRKGPLRRHVNLMLTMLLGGLWHGAGWTFVLWGGLHGLYLIINHVWQAFRRRVAWDSNQPGSVENIAGIALTFFVVVIAWVFFRAADLPSALRVLGGMAGLNGFVVPAGWTESLPSSIVAAVRMCGWTFGDPGTFQGSIQVAWLAALLSIAWFAPNSQQIMSRYRPYVVSASSPESRPPVRLRWSPTRSWALPLGVIAALALASLGRVSEFLYFQF